MHQTSNSFCCYCFRVSRHNVDVRRTLTLAIGRKVITLKPNHSLRNNLSCAIALSLFSLNLSLATTVSAQEHVANPFVGASSYVNPDYTKEVDSSIAKVNDPTLKAKMATVKSYPTAIWLDSIASIGGGSANSGRMSLRDHLDAALAQRKGNEPITANFIIYDLPGRDCHALASNGELPLTEQGLARYKKEYIDAVAGIFADPKYKDIRIVAIIEPDSLPNLVTNMSTFSCAQAANTGIYERGIQYALDKLHAIPNVYNYVDIGHSGWLGWENNSRAAVPLFTRVIKGTAAGLSSTDGFITDTANTTPLEEPNLPDSNFSVGSRPLRSSKFYEWNPYFGEIAFAQGMYNQFVAAGWPASLSFLIDTGRNGWGGPQRPTSASGSDVDSYVNSGRVDRRLHRGNWCNQAGAGIGVPPTTAPAEHIAAYVWAKPPGESDGSSRLIPNNQGKGFDRMCDPSFLTPDGVLSGAKANAPLSGEWFHEHFVDLVNNAYPAIASSSTSAPAPAPALKPAPAPEQQPVPAPEQQPAPAPAQKPAPKKPAPKKPVHKKPAHKKPAPPAQKPAPAPAPALKPAPAPAQKPAPAPTQQPAPAPAPERALPGNAQFSVSKTVTSDWTSGYCSSVKVTNTGSTSGQWSIQTQISGRVSSLWNANWSQQNQVLTASGMGWNQNLRPNETAEFGFCANR